MKFWTKLLAHVKPPRDLTLTLSGKWYLALTIAMGVVALISGNNVLYLIESLLLSGLIFSGILSERTLSAVEIKIKRVQAYAEQKTRDLIFIKNTKNFPIFCIDIEEIKQRGMPNDFLAYINRLGPKETLVLESSQILPHRGIYSWQGIRLTTSYPFGFATKAKNIYEEGKRTVWPAVLKNKKLALAHSSSHKSTDTQVSLIPRLGSHPTDGEIRPTTFEDNPRWIIWSKSALGLDPIARALSDSTDPFHAVLDTRTQDQESFENLIKKIATLFYNKKNDSGWLTLLYSQGKKTIKEKKAALNTLAVVQISNHKEVA